MVGDQIGKFIDLMQQNDFQIKLRENNIRIFKEVLIVKSKSFLSPKIFIVFTGVPCSNRKNLLTEIEELNKQINNNKPIICVLIVSDASTPEDNLWFNSNIFVHIVLYNEKINSLSFGDDFHYSGSKFVREIIGIMEKVIT